MKGASVKQLKDELKHRDANELMTLCLRLARFKKENKELLTYLLFEAGNELGYIEAVKEEISEQFRNMNKKNYYFQKKSIRKILSNTKKYIRYSKIKETEIELLLHFLTEMKALRPSVVRQLAMNNLYYRQIDMIKKASGTLHEDLQYEHNLELEKLYV